jgi:hypothetical protein
LDIGENRIAKCYLLHDNDEKNKCELTDRRLSIVRKNMRSEFAIENLKSLSINHRKLLIPIILSGILTPLILVGFFKDIFHPLIALVFIISGVFSFYIGWIGEKVITVNLIMAYRDFPVSIVTDHVEGFIDYVNQYIRDEPMEKRVLYLEVKDRIEGITDVDSHLGKDVINRKLFSYWELNKCFQSGELRGEASYIVLDPVKVGSEVKYEKGTNARGLRPVIKGPVKRNAVIKIIHINDLYSMFG